VRCTQYNRLEEDFDITEHAEELKSTQLPLPVRQADVCLGSPDDPWIDRFGAVHDPANEPATAGVKEEDLRDTLLAASQTGDPQYRRDLVLAYLQCAPEAPSQAGRAAGPQKVLLGVRGNDAISPQPPRKEPEPAKAHKPAAKVVPGA
jgi:hypothetical protein